MLNIQNTCIHTQHPYLESFFDTEVDLTGNPNTNI